MAGRMDLDGLQAAWNALTPRRCLFWPDAIGDGSTLKRSGLAAGGQGRDSERHPGESATTAATTGHLLRIARYNYLIDLDLLANQSRVYMKPDHVNRRGATALPT